MIRKRKGKHASISLKKKLFLIMIGISIIPTAIITSLASVSTYRKHYEDTIQINSEGMNWSHSQLTDFADAMKQIFYSMDFTQEYKQALQNISRSSETYEDMAALREVMLNQMNRNSFLRSFLLTIPEKSTRIYADRASVRNISTEKETFPVLTREREMQTNLYFKQIRNTLLAVHHIHRFQDRSLLAQQIAVIRSSTLENLLSTLQIYENERIYILNDEGEILLSLYENGTEASLFPSHFIQSLADDASVPAIKLVKHIEHNQEIIFSTFSENRKVSIVKIVPKSEIIQTVFPTIYTGVILGFLGLFVSIAASAVLSSVISRPIGKLAERVKNIELETLDFPNDADTEDEVRILEDHINLFIQRIKELIRNEYDIQLQNRLAHINALQAQINPHFLHNTLQLIGSISLAKDTPEVYRISSALSAIMRYSMDFETSFVPLRKELDYLDNFLFIQKQRFSDRFSVEKNIEPKAEKCLVPKLIIQPLAENAFSHGFSGKNGKWHLRITAWLDAEEMLHVCVLDNGKGMSNIKLQQLTAVLEQQGKETRFRSLKSDTNHHDNSAHIGLINVHDRLLLAFPGRSGMHISSSEEKGTKIELYFEARTSLQPHNQYQIQPYQ